MQVGAYGTGFRKYSFWFVFLIVVSVNITARFGRLVSAAYDFGEMLESLGLLLGNLEFFAYPAFMQDVQKKGRV